MRNIEKWFIHSIYLLIFMFVAPMLIASSCDKGVIGPAVQNAPLDDNDVNGGDTEYRIISGSIAQNGLDISFKQMSVEDLKYLQHFAQWSNKGPGPNTLDKITIFQAFNDGLYSTLAIMNLGNNSDSLVVYKKDNTVVPAVFQKTSDGTKMYKKWPTDINSDPTSTSIRNPSADEWKMFEHDGFVYFTYESMVDNKKVYSAIFGVEKISVETAPLNNADLDSLKVKVVNPKLSFSNSIAALKITDFVDAQRLKETFEITIPNGGFNTILSSPSYGPSDNTIGTIFGLKHPGYPAHYGTAPFTLRYDNAKIAFAITIDPNDSSPAGIIIDEFFTFQDTGNIQSNYTNYTNYTVSSANGSKISGVILPSSYSFKSTDGLTVKLYIINLEATDKYHMFASQPGSLSGEGKFFLANVAYKLEGYSFEEINELIDNNGVLTGFTEAPRIN